jgi:ABC-type multidrug transport system fused ATPase/permease subunit
MNCAILVIIFLRFYFIFMSKTSIPLISIAFDKPWWHIIVGQPFYLTILILSVTLRDLFWTLEPFLVAFVLEYQDWYFFGVACILWVLSELNLIVTAVVNPRFQLSIIHSIFYSAHQRLLVIDPKYHTKRSSGVILAKIERAARGFEDLLDQITFEFAPLCIGVVSVLIILSRHSWPLTLTVFFCLVCMIAYAYYFARYTSQRLEKDHIQADDAFKATAFENLAQVQLVRSTFATDFMRDKLSHKITENSLVEERLWRSYSFVTRILNAIYTVSVILLVAYFMLQIKASAVTLAHAVGLILAYITCTHTLIRIIHPLRRYMRGYTAVNDLFGFMQLVGQQTIPVFDGRHEVVLQDSSYTLTTDELTFSYGDVRLFDNHRLSLHCGIDQESKLYGIIGPSGAGKTTLLSMLGGQLKPATGSVYINGHDIYAVDDDTRRRLIAIQGQVATAMQGAVRYNLLFGLPEHHGYHDDYLIDILHRVGLQILFTEHKGLETMLGEGAFALSGGQRQRLNFAALYVRAAYYKPPLVLIDEPTSSLDEISERSITTMVLELSRNSLTLVIAHRLKTLDQACGLFDLSMLHEDRLIRPYSVNELRIRSSYYQKLMTGVHTIA